MPVNSELSFPISDETTTTHFNVKTLPLKYFEINLGLET